MCLSNGLEHENTSVQRPYDKHSGEHAPCALKMDPGGQPEQEDTPATGDIQPLKPACLIGAFDLIGQSIGPESKKMTMMIHRTCRLVESEGLTRKATRYA